MRPHSIECGRGAIRKCSQNNDLLVQMRAVDRNLINLIKHFCEWTPNSLQQEDLGPASGLRFFCATSPLACKVDR